MVWLKISKLHGFSKFISWINLLFHYGYPCAWWIFLTQPRKLYLSMIEKCWALRSVQLKNCRHPTCLRSGSAHTISTVSILGVPQDHNIFIVKDEKWQVLSRTKRYDIMALARILHVYVLCIAMSFCIMVHLDKGLKLKFVRQVSLREPPPCHIQTLMNL